MYTVWHRIPEDLNIHKCCDITHHLWQAVIWELNKARQIADLYSYHHKN